MAQQEDNQPTTSATQFTHEWPTEATLSEFQAAIPYASSPVRYMWGGQQPLMPPYAAYNAYSQLGPPLGQSSTKAFQMDGNIEGARLPRIDTPYNDPGKDVKNGVFQSSGSGSEGSSEGSEDDHANKDMNAFREMAMEVLESNNSGGAYGSYSGAMGIPRTDSNVMGSTSSFMDYWSGNVPRVQPWRKAKHTLPPTETMVPSAGRDTSDLWTQDERELKRQRRKQSNRESARRSRLRKQAECEELSTRVDALAVENVALRSELSRLIEERDKLAQENASLMEQLLERSQHKQDAKEKREYA